jgi:hypothetical protein
MYKIVKTNGHISLPDKEEYIQKVLSKIDHADYQSYLEEILFADSCFVIGCCSCPFYPGPEYSCFQSCRRLLVPYVQHPMVDGDLHIPDLIRTCRGFLLTQYMEAEFEKHNTQTENIIT